jgi:hypothetical protein
MRYNASQRVMVSDVSKALFSFKSSGKLPSDAALYPNVFLSSARSCILVGGLRFRGCVSRCMIMYRSSGLLWLF